MGGLKGGKARAKALSSVRAMPSCGTPLNASPPAPRTTKRPSCSAARPSASTVSPRSLWRLPRVPNAMAPRIWSENAGEASSSTHLGSFGAHGFLRDGARPHPFAVLDPSLSLERRQGASRQIVTLKSQRGQPRRQLVRHARQICRRRPNGRNPLLLRSAAGRPVRCTHGQS